LSKAFSCRTSTSSETRELGRRLQGFLESGDVLLLSGDLGAGKSELMRGIAQGLGIAGPIPSPTFTLLNLYTEGSLPLKHFDWYRVQDAEELRASGLDEMIGGEGLTAIEWHERAPELLPPDCLEIILTTLSEDAREIRFLPHGQFRELDYSFIAQSKGEGL
jgi:tRNA threonylcarbamoyladenosine biosynthesis protein TsaE